MAVDHVGGWLYRHTWQALGYASAAEGFVLLSGYVTAWVTLGPSPPPRMMFSRLHARAFCLYRYHIGLLAILWVAAAAVPALGAMWAEWLRGLPDNPLGFGMAAVLLLHIPKYFGILPLYIIFLAFAPLVLLLLRRGYGPFVLGVSLGCWALAQRLNPVGAVARQISPTLYPGYFNILAWQFLFIAGMWMGYARVRGRQPVWERHRITLWIVLPAATVLALVRHRVLPGIFVSPEAVDRADLGWLRVVNVCLLAVVFATVIKTILPERGLPWLRRLGRRSLQVYTFHILLLYVALALHQWLRIDPHGPAYVLFVAAMLAGMTIPAIPTRMLPLRKTGAYSAIRGRRFPEATLLFRLFHPSPGRGSRGRSPSSTAVEA